MPVPESIRSVARPTNTVVVDTGSKGPNRYAVRERARSVCLPHKNPSPRNGRTIGHIIDGCFIPVVAKPQLAPDGPEWLSYGSCALVYSVSQDLFSDLLGIFSPNDAMRIMAMAMIKIVHPRVANSRLQQQYGRTFTRCYYPVVALSKNTVSNFLKLLGQDGDKRRAFYKRRLEAVEKSHHIAIDGTLKQDTSIVNSLSQFSRKARVKGCRDISILYAFDIERMEPVCAHVYAGNIIDAKAYRAFIVDNDIKKGLILADKGFPPSEIADELQKRKDLHFLTPLKRNDKRIAANNMLSFQNVVSGLRKRVQCKKTSLEDGHFLYSFRDASRAHMEENSFLDRAIEHGYDAQAYQKKAQNFGTIVFESDQDLTPEAVWHCYEDRWLLELVFDRYKNDEQLSQTRVQREDSIIGEEFVNFVATILTCRILRKADLAHVLDKMTYGDLMQILGEASRKIKVNHFDPHQKPSALDGQWVNTTQEALEIMEALGLCEPAPKPEPRPRGRPRKVKQPRPEFVGPKRPVGRPRKHHNTGSQPV